MEDFKTAKKVAGIKQALKAVEKELAGKVFIAADADRRLLKPLIELCEKKSVPLEMADDMQDLGRRCGIQVGAAAVALLKFR
jgi:large subunit ribosomal protein L7A